MSLSAIIERSQIDLYLRKRVPFIEGAKDWQYYRDKIQTIHDLSDLMRRPVLLEMIVKTLPTLIAEGKAINRPNLYQYYLEGELERQLAKQRYDLQIYSQQRFAIMERMALEMYLTAKTELTSDQIREIAKEILTTEQRDELEGSLREILACSFLNRTGDAYHFSHLSFLEYLIARCLAQDIARGRKETLRQKRISPTIQDFLLELEVEARQRSRNDAISVDTGNKDISFNYKTLEQWFCENPEDKWVSSNAISLLAKLMPHDQFCKLPLQEGDLSGVDFSGANLSGVDFSRIHFSRKGLSENIDYQGPSTTVSLAIGGAFGGASTGGLPGAIVGTIGGAIVGAIVGTIISAIGSYTHLNLSEANLSGANLHEANLSGVDLHKANLHEANLSGVDLHKANLHEANLSKASGLELTRSLKRTDMRGVKGLAREQLKTCQQRGAIIDEDAAAATDAPPVLDTTSQSQSKSTQ